MNFEHLFGMKNFQFSTDDSLDVFTFNYYYKHNKCIMQKLFKAINQLRRQHAFFMHAMAKTFVTTNSFEVGKKITQLSFDSTLYHGGISIEIRLDRHLGFYRVMMRPGHYNHKGNNR